MNLKTNGPGGAIARANSPLDEIESEDNHPQFNKKSANSQENCRIYRTDKNADSGNTFTRTDNRVIYDTSLTPLARLAMVYLLSKPDNWQVRKSDLRRYLECGVNKVETVISELKDAGYLNRYQKQDDNGQWLPSETFIFEVPELNNRSMKTIERPNSELNRSMKTVGTVTVPTVTVPTVSGVHSNNGQATTDLPTTEEKTKERESHEKNEISNGKSHEQADVVKPLSLSENSSHFSSVGIYKSVTNGFINAAVEKTCQEIQAYPNYSDDKFLEVLVQLDSQGDGKNKPLFQAGKILAAAQKEFSSCVGVSKVKLFSGKVVEARIERGADTIWAVYETQELDKSSDKRYLPRTVTVEKRVSVEEAYYGGSISYEERKPHISEEPDLDIYTGEYVYPDGRRVDAKNGRPGQAAPKREYTPIEEPSSVIDALSGEKDILTKRGIFRSGLYRLTDTLTASIPGPDGKDITIEVVKVNGQWQEKDYDPDPEPETMADKWQNVKEYYLKRAMSTDTYHQHFAQTKVLDYNDNTNVLTIGAAEMSIEWLETRLEPPITDAIKFAGYDFTVKFVSLEDVKRAIFSK